MKINKLMFLISIFLYRNCICFTNHKIVILTCSYNNKQYYKDSLLSLFNQTYTDWECYYIDDNSTDGTAVLAYELAKEYGMLDKVHFIVNDKNLGAMQNQYNAIHLCSDDSVIVILDGDDKFYDNSVLKFIYDTYCDPCVWLTYGSYVSMKEPFHVYCEDVSNKNTKDRHFFRKYPWAFSHLRTFYAGLFKKIKKEDLMYNGEFVSSVPDLAAMYPMLEMANGEIKHYKYISKKLYVYNNMNPICEFRRNDLNKNMANFIRSKEPYLPIEMVI